MYLTGSLQWLFGFLALALFVYGTILVTAVKMGVWFRAKRPARLAKPSSQAASVPACDHLSTATQS